MTEEWEYEEEELHHLNQRSYLDSCPPICRNCRWLDWYYELGCTQMAYPVDDKCVLYTHTDHFKRFRVMGYDLHYKWWQLRTWLYSLVGLKPNIVGSWRQWEYSEDCESDLWDDEDSWLEEDEH